MTKKEIRVIQETPPTLSRSARSKREMMTNDLLKRRFTCIQRGLAQSIPGNNSLEKCSYLPVILNQNEVGPVICALEN